VGRPAPHKRGSNLGWNWTRANGPNRAHPQRARGGQELDRGIVPGQLVLVAEGLPLSESGAARQVIRSRYFPNLAGQKGVCAYTC